MTLQLKGTLKSWMSMQDPKSFMLYIEIYTYMYKNIYTHMHICVYRYIYPHPC